LHIPRNIIKIEDFAFLGCDNLRKVIAPIAVRESVDKITACADVEYY